MIRIREEQLRVLEASVHEQFVQRVLAHLRRVLPEGDDEGWLPLVREGIARARGYGLTSARTITSYIDLFVVLGDSFDRDPALPFASILRDEALAPEQKIERCLAAARRVDDV